MKLASRVRRAPVVVGLLLVPLAIVLAFRAPPPPRLPGARRSALGPLSTSSVPTAADSPGLPAPRGLRRSPDAIAAIHPEVREVFDGAGLGERLCAMFELEEAENVWIQVVEGQINMSYPFADDPLARLAAGDVRGRQMISLASWKPAVSATFDYDPAASPRDVAELVDQLFIRVLGVEDESYPLTTSVFPLARRR